MATDTGRSPRLGRTLWAVIAAVPLAAGAVGLWDAVLRYPVVSACALVGYVVVVAGARIGTEVYGDFAHFCVRVADTLNAVPRRVTSGFGRRYRRYLAEAHRDVELRVAAPRGMRPLPLEQIFVDLNLGPAGHRSIWDFLRSAGDRPLAVIGAPGSGKTTLLKHVTLVLARGGRPARTLSGSRPRTPILVQLREHAAAIAANPRLTLADVARSSLRLPEPPRWFDRQLATGRCVVLLDGLDDVARQDDRRVVVDWVRQQTAAVHRRNVFVLTSRAYTVAAQPLPRATVLRVRPFTLGQITTFVQQWYLATAGDRDEGVRQAARIGADDLLTQLRASGPLAGLAANPLQLTLIANVHHHGGKLPGGRVDLYREVCQLLLARRRPPIETITPVELGPDQKEYVLRELALAMMERGIRDVAGTHAADLIAPALASVRPEMDPQEFLAATELTSGLLLERAGGVHCFTHQTLQEYLAAAQLRDADGGGLLLDQLGSEWWRETTLMYAAQADASPLVAACLDAGKPPAALLAFAAELAEQAERLDPDLRKRLTEALDAAAIR